MTTDGTIHVMKEAKAAWDNSDQQFHVVLSCGTFSYLTYPPFDVEWTVGDANPFLVNKIREYLEEGGG